MWCGYIFHWISPRHFVEFFAFVTKLRLCVWIAGVLLFARQCRCLFVMPQSHLLACLVLRHCNSLSLSVSPPLSLSLPPSLPPSPVPSPVTASRFPVVFDEAMMLLTALGFRHCLLSPNQQFFVLTRETVDLGLAASLPSTQRAQRHLALRAALLRPLRAPCAGGSSLQIWTLGFLVPRFRLLALGKAS